MEPFIGMIVQFGGNFAPRGWALCDGQLLSIAQNQALFSILGTTYGGDGRTSFALPDLRGRFAMHPGSGPGLTTRRLGQKGGVEDHNLTVNQLPAHSHGATGTIKVYADTGNQDEAEGHNFANAETDLYTNQAANALMTANNVDVTVGSTGAGQAVENIPPFQCVNFIIALTGTFPSRN